MTTDPDTNQQIDAAAVWRAVGRLEAKMDALADRMEEFSRGVDHLSRRLDRMFYAVLAGGGVLIAAMFASRFIGS